MKKFKEFVTEAIKSYDSNHPEFEAKKKEAGYNEHGTRVKSKTHREWGTFHKVQTNPKVIEQRGKKNVETAGRHHEHEHQVAHYKDHGYRIIGDKPFHGSKQVNKGSMHDAYHKTLGGLTKHLNQIGHHVKESDLAHIKDTD